jgi:hypothetical protein
MNRLFTACISPSVDIEPVFCFKPQMLVMILSILSLVLPTLVLSGETDSLVFYDATNGRDSSIHAGATSGYETNPPFGKQGSGESRWRT